MSYAIGTLTRLPFENIIGGPLSAAVVAQTEAAKATVEFIKEVGFKPPADDTNNSGAAMDLSDGTGDRGVAKDDADMGEVRNICFTYESKNGEGVVRNAKLTVPVLTIVTIPMLRIDEVSIDFMAKITEVVTRQDKQSQVTDRSSSLSVGFRSFWSSVRVGFNASYSSKNTSSSASSSRYSSEMNLNVHVRAVQDEMPAGLSRVLTMLENIIEEDNTATE